MANMRVHRPSAKAAFRNFAIGDPISGVRRTNALWYKRGIRVPAERFEHDPRAGWYEPTPLGHWLADLGHNMVGTAPTTGHGFLTGGPWRSGFERMTVRWVSTAGLVGLPAVWFSDQAVWIHPTMVGVGLTTVGAVVTGRVRNWTTADRTRIEFALRSQLRDLLKTEHVRVKTMVRDGQTVGLELVIPHDVALTKVRQSEILALVQVVLPVLDDVRWPDLVTGRTIVLGQRPQPPRLVTYADMRARMLAAPEGTVVLGLDAGSQAVSHDLNTDPHILMSASTGKGKSKTYATLISQFLEWGCEIQLGDVKQISLHEFAEAPGVMIHTEVEAIENALLLFEQEMMERYKVLKGHTVNEWGPILDAWQRKIFMLEELNAYFALEAQRYQTKTNIPAFNSLTRILAMARQVKMHVVVTGQKLDGRVLPNGIGENFGCRLFSNPTPSTWRSLGEGKKPPSSRVPGRTVKLNGGETEIYQATLTQPEEALMHSATPRKAWASNDLGQTNASSLLDATSDLGQAKSGLTLRDIAQRTGVSLETVRSRADRGAYGEPIGVGQRGAKLYAAPAGGFHAPSYDPTEVIIDSDE
jgi:DNA translocase FtsK/SpoIIIE-like protein